MFKWEGEKQGSDGGGGGGRVCVKGVGCVCVGGRFSTAVRGSGIREGVYRGGVSGEE